ncbi:MAG TPA: tetratricopeptide repeat protein, partial [Bacteroidetes bacterium]|nr:tetratricopeptide repeat protein [Bacteroidota bacterium]
MTPARLILYLYAAPYICTFQNLQMRKSIYCLALACLLFTALLPAQNLAELEASFSKTSDPEQQLELLQKMAKTAEQTDLGQSLTFIKQGVALAEKTDSKEQLPRFYEMEGRVYANTQKFDSATVFFDKALAGYVAVGDKKGEASAWLKKAYISRWSTDFGKALEYDFKALALMEALSDDSGTAGVYEHIAQDLGHQKKPEKAMEYVQKSIALAKKSGDNRQLMYSLGTAGTTSLLTEDFQKFYDYINQAINLAHAENMSPGEIAPLYNDRGNALKFLGRYDEAIADYKRCLNISKKTHFK